MKALAVIEDETTLRDVAVFLSICGAWLLAGFIQLISKHRPSGLQRQDRELSVFGIMRPGFVA